MAFRWSRPPAAAIALLLGTSRLAAQIDYRNLDDGRPTRVTDAAPVERFAFELSVPYGFAFGSGATRHTTSPHLEYGIARNLMVGVGASLVAGHTGVADDHSSLAASVLWSFRRETPSLPALSLSMTAGQTLSGRGFGSDAAMTVGVLATRSIGRARLHANAAVAVIAPDLRSAEFPTWWAGVAGDYTFIRSSTLLVAELLAQRERSGTPISWNAGVGFRRQISPTVVLHGGISQALEGGGLGTEARLGLSYLFAIAGLLPGGAR